MRQGATGGDAAEPRPAAVVTPEHVRALLRTSGRERVLIVLKGGVEVVDAASLESPKYAGALHVASSRDLDSMAALSSPDKADPEALASLLQAAVAELGA